MRDIADEFDQIFKKDNNITELHAAGMQLSFL
jgi:hypothetical protein